MVGVGGCEEGGERVGGGGGEGVRGGQWDRGWSECVFGGGVRGKEGG